jgi:putative membrane protein
MHVILTTALLTDDGWHHGWWLWPLIPLAWFVVLALLFRFVFRRGRWGRCGGRGGPGGPRRILAERYARGEIDAAEYRDRLGTLENVT